MYLVFSKTDTWLSRAIYFLGNLQYPHTSISFDDSFNQLYSFGRTNPNNPLSGGFVVESFYDGMFKKCSNSRCAVYRIKITEEQYNNLLKEVERFKKEQNKFRYNFLGLFGVILHRPIIRKHHYFCSQFVSEVMINSKVYDTTKIPALISTSDLYDMEDKELVYEGYIHDYKDFLYQRTVNS